MSQVSPRQRWHHDCNVGVFVRAVAHAEDRRKYDRVRQREWRALQRGRKFDKESGVEVWPADKPGPSGRGRPPKSWVVERKRRLALNLPLDALTAAIDSEHPSDDEKNTATLRAELETERVKIRGLVRHSSSKEGQ